MPLKPASYLLSMSLGDFLLRKHVFHEKIHVFLIRCYPDFLSAAFIGSFWIVARQEKNIKKSIKTLPIPRTYRFFSKQFPENLFPKIVSSRKVCDVAAPAAAHFHGFFQIIHASEGRSHGTENKIKGLAVALFIKVKALEITGMKTGVGQLFLFQIFHAVSDHFF